MTQLDTSIPPVAMASKGSLAPRNNVYTALSLVAMLALLIGVGYIAYKNTQLTGQGNPFAILENK